MKKIFFVFAFLISIVANAVSIDSSKVALLINEGHKQFCRILDINDEAISGNKKENMQFVIELPANYLHNETYGSNYGQTFNDPVIKDSLNARIRRIYTEYGVELYIVLINSLDVIISTPLPAGATAQSFFQTKLYNESSNIATLKSLHNTITDRIINQSLSGQNRDCIVFSDAQYCGSFTSDTTKKGCWQFSVLSKHNGPVVSYASLDPLEEYFKIRLLTNHDALAGGINGQLVTTVDEFRESVKYIRLKGLIRQSFHPLLLDAIFINFDEDIDYKNLSLTDRIHALSVYTGFSMTGGWFTIPSQEAHAIKIIKYTPPDDVHDLLYALEQPNSLKNNPSYHGDNTDDALIKKLIDHTDDGGLPFTENNYSELVKVITRLMMSSSQTLGEHLPATDEQWLSRRIYWDDSYLFTVPPIGTHKYDVTFNPNGTLEIQKEIVDRLDVDYNNAAVTANYTAHWDNSYSSFPINPFDLVFFTNRSSLGMLQSAGVQRDSILIAPAIFLKYADDKTFNSNAIKIGAVTLDVIAIAIGPGAILAAIESGSMALAAFEVTQLLGSVGNLAVQGITDPQLQSVVEKYNLIVGIWGLSKIVTSGTKYTVSYLTEASAGELHALPISTAQEFETAFHQAGSKIDDLTPEMRDKLKRMEKYLGDKVGVGPAGFNVNLISSLLETAPNKAFFWSGKTNGIGGAEKALEIANNKGGTTLEGLINQNNIEIPSWNINDPISVKVWEDVSAEYAKKANGNVYAVIGQDLRPGNIWEAKELPALIANPNVSKIIKIDPETLIETTIFVR